MTDRPVLAARWAQEQVQQVLTAPRLRVVAGVLAAGLAIAAAWADSPVAGDRWLRVTLLADCWL